MKGSEAVMVVPAPEDEIPQVATELTHALVHAAEANAECALPVLRLAFPVFRLGALPRHRLVQNRRSNITYAFCPAAYA
jgi:hypothetical protein